MIKGGPKIINDSLVLCLDAHDAKSYAGEPTTNNLDSSNRANANTGPNVSNNFASIAMTKGVVNYSSDRPHVYSFKSTNAIGYVSIGYNSSIQNQSGSVYAFSFDYKVIRADSGTTTNLNTAGITVYGNGYKNPTSATTASNISSSEVELHDGWKRVTKTYACGYTGYNQTRQDLSTGDAGDFEVLIDNIQFEDKTYSTPFANLSRSATNGWVDRSGNSNSGTLVNGTNTGVSHYRNGEVIMPVSASYLDFDGSDDQITIANSSSYNNASSKTVEVWVRAETGVAGLFNIICSNRLANDTDVNFSLYLDDRKVVRPWNASGNDEMVLFYQIGNGSTIFEAFSKEKLGTTTGDNLWHCVVGVTDTASSKILLYYDGEYVHEKAFTGTPNIPASNLRLGSGYGSTNTSYPFSGQYGTFRIYNKALTAAEVLSNYNAMKPRFGL